MQNHWVAARRIRYPRVTPVFGLVCVAWLVLIGSAVASNGAVIRHDRLIQGGPPLWLATLFFLAGWQVMLWAMMVSPSLGVIDGYRGFRDKFSFVVGYCRGGGGAGGADRRARVDRLTTTRSL